MASSSSDDGGGSDVADFVEQFELDSDDGELPQPPKANMGTVYPLCFFM